jgi:nucleoside-diphosphate-sugar epimerase
MGGGPVSVVVITGAAGLVGSMLRPRLARRHRTLRLVDLQALTAEAYAAEVIAEHGEPDPEHDPVLRYLAGEFTLPDAQVPQA